MKKTISKTTLLQLITGLFVGCLIISNVLAAKTFTIAGVVLPSAVILFPIVYIVNDVLTEIYGFKKARQVILLGFVVNALAVVSYTIAIALPAPQFSIEAAAAFKTTLASSWRVLAASFSAYLVGSIMNALVMEKMKLKLEKYLMLRCVLSTVIGEGLDAIIFISIAFIGTMGTMDLITMIFAQAAFKIVYEIIIYPFTRLTIKKVRQLNE